MEFLDFFMQVAGMLPLATDQTAIKIIDGTTELSAGFLVVKSVVEGVQDYYSPKLFSSLSSSKYLKFLPMLAGMAPWLTFSSTAFDIYQVLDRYIEGKSEDQDFSLFMSSLLFLGEGAFFASSPILAMGLGLVGLGINFVGAKNSDESNANAKDFGDQLTMMGLFTASRVLSRTGRGQLKEIKNHISKAYSEFDPKEGMKEFSDFAWSMAVGRLSDPWGRRLAFGIPAVGALLACYEAVVSDYYSLTGYLANEIIDKWLKADVQTFIDLLDSENNNNDPLIRNRAITSLGDLLAGNRLTNEERRKIIQDLKALPIDKDATLPALVAAALEQASKKQRAFLLRANSEKEAEKISQAIAEMTAIGGENNIQFFTDNTILPDDIRQVGINFIQKNSWPIYLRTMMEEGTLDDAIAQQQFKIDHQIIPNSSEIADAYTKLGHLKLMAHRFNEAKEAYEKAINIDQNQGEAYLGLAELALKNREALEALRYLDLVQALMPEFDWKLNYNRAMALMINGEVDEAVKYLGMSISQIRQDPVQAEEWANFYASYGKLDPALKYIQEAERRNPGDLTIKNNLAIILSKLENEQDALAAYEQGLKIYEGQSNNEKSEREKNEHVIYLANFLYRLGKAKQYERAYDITEKILANPHAELLQDSLRQSLFQLKNQEFSEVGENVQLQMGGILANLLNPTPQQIKDEIEYWKKVITDPEVSDENKQKALVVLTKLGSFLEDGERVDLSLWTMQAVKNQKGVVQEFGIIATGRMVEGVADTKKLYELNAWLIDAFSNHQDYSGSALAKKVLEKTAAHLDEESALVLAEESSKKLKSRSSTDVNDAFSLLTIFVPHLPLEKRARFADLMVPFLNDQRDRFDTSSMTAVGHLIPYLEEDKRLHYSEILLTKLKYVITGYPGVTPLENAPRIFSEFIPSLKLDDRKKIAQHIYDRINQLSSSTPSLNFDDPSRGIYLFMQLLAEIVPLLNNDDKIIFSNNISLFLENNATDLRSSAVTTLVAVIPSLPSEKRSVYLDKLVEKLDDKNSGVRSESLEGLVTLIASSDEKERQKYMVVVMGRLEKDTSFATTLSSINLTSFFSLMSPDIKSRYKKFLLDCFDEEVGPDISQSTFGLVSQFIPFLNSEEQTVYVDKLVGKLKSQNERLDFSHLLIFLNLIPRLDKKIQEKYVTDLLLLVQSSPNLRLISDSRQNRLLDDFMSSLEPAARSNLAIQITPWLQNSNEAIRLRALDFFQFLIPYLNKDDQEKYIFLTLETVKSDKVKDSIKQVFSYLAPLIDKEVCAHVVSHIVEKIKSNTPDNSFLLMALCPLIPSLDTNQQIQNTNLVLTYLDQPDDQIRLTILSSLQPLVLKMDVQSRRACADKIVTMLKNNNAQIRQATISILNPLISNLKPEEQVKYINQVMPLLKDPEIKTRQKVCDFLSFIPSSALSSAIKIDYLKQVMRAAEAETDEQTYANEMKFFVRLIPDVSEADREFFIPSIIDQLKKRNFKHSSQIGQAIAKLVLYLDESAKYEIISAIDGCLMDPDAVIRSNTLFVLEQVIPVLDEREQEAYMQKVVGHLSDRDQSVQPIAARTLKALAYLWDETEKRQMALFIEDKLKRGQATGSEQLLILLSRSFSNTEKKESVLRWIESIKNPNDGVGVRTAAITIIPALLILLREEDRLYFASQIEDLVTNPANEISSAAVSVLGQSMRSLPAETRLDRVKKMILVLKRPGFLVVNNMSGPFSLAVQALNDDERKEGIRLIAVNLDDPDAQVRANTLLVLSPIIFSFRGREKRSYVNKAVICLLDQDQKVRGAAVSFIITVFLSLKQKDRIEIVKQAMNNLEDETEKKKFRTAVRVQLDKKNNLSPEEKKEITDALITP